MARASSVLSRSDTSASAGRWRCSRSHRWRLEYAALVALLSGLSRRNWLPNYGIGVVAFTHAIQHPLRQHSGLGHADRQDRHLAEYGACQPRSRTALSIQPSSGYRASYPALKDTFASDQMLEKPRHATNPEVAAAERRSVLAIATSVRKLQKGPLSTPAATVNWAANNVGNLPGLSSAGAAGRKASAPLNSQDRARTRARPDSQNPEAWTSDMRFNGSLDKPAVTLRRAVAVVLTFHQG